MILRKFYNVDEMPLGLALAASGIIYHATVGSPGQVNCVLMNDQKWLSGTNGGQAIGFPITGIGLNNTVKTVFGARVFTDTPANTHAGTMYSASAALQLITCSNVGMVAGYGYLECVLDWVNFTQSVYLNGNLVAGYTKQFTSAQMASILTTYPNLLIGGSAAGGSWWVRDVSIREYIAGETYVPWKSPRFNEITLDTVAAPGYVASNGDTPTNVINTPFADYSTGLSAPSLDLVMPTQGAAPVTGTPRLMNKFSGPILGVEFLDTFKCTEASLGSMQGTLIQGSQSIVGPRNAQTAAYQYRKPVFGNPLAVGPDGLAFTRTKLATMLLSIANVN